jgi:hypothetical protein
MRIRHRKYTMRAGPIALTALMVTALLTMLPVSAGAPPPGGTVTVTCPTNSTSDADNDGFTDAQECAGILLNQGTAPFVTIQSCFTANGARTALDRSLCLDPNSPDLFVILVPAASSLIPANFFEFVAKPKPSPGLGLGITIHQINNDQASTTSTTDRLLSSVSTQKAVRVTEKTENLASGTVLGQATNGTPITTGKVAVWPVRILQHVNEVRVAAGLAALPATDLVVVTYIKQVIAHEMGHVMGPLANVSTQTATAYGGKHYAPEDHVVMSQYVTNDGVGNFQIGDDFKSGDQTSVKLK